MFAMGLLQNLSDQLLSDTETTNNSVRFGLLVDKAPTYDDLLQAIRVKSINGINALFQLQSIELSSLNSPGLLSILYALNYHWTNMMLCLI